MSRLSYYTKLSGTSFRQEAIAKLKPGKTKLRIIAHEDNEYDPYACEVQALLDDWTQIGWIQKGKNQDIHDFILAGGTVDITLKEVTGLDKDTLGVNVGVTYGKDDSVDVSILEIQQCDFGDAEFIYWDERNHKAYDIDGNELQSGSATEHKYLPEPDFSYPAKAIAKRTGLKPSDVMALWEEKSNIAKMYGTLMHRCLEDRIKYLGEMNAIDELKKRAQHPDNWMPDYFGDAVYGILWQIKTRLNELGVLKFSTLNFYPEARLKYKNLTGIADLIYRVGENGFFLFDYKTNEEIKEVKYDKYGKLTKYTLQQNHYRTILEKLGMKCLGMWLLHWTGSGWDWIKIDKVDIEQEIK